MSFRSAVRMLAFIAAMFAGLAPALAAERVLVFAAASLKNALDEVVALYNTESRSPVVVSYAASSTLARQIGHGAPADIFLSADEDWMNDLARQDLIDAATRKNILGGRLVLIAPAAHLPAAPVTFAAGPLLEALGGGRLAMADVAAVPAGKYGKAALQKLGLWEAVENHVAQAQDVRAALAFVARGEAPLGIVYATDAVAEPKVKVVATFPDDSHAPIIYPAAILKGAPDAKDALAFLQFVRSPAAARVFERQGFGVLP